MRRTVILVFTLLAMVLAISSTCLAKPPKVKLTIEGGSLVKAVEVTDPKILELSYSRGFAPPPPQGLRGYRITVYFKTLNDETPNMFFVFFYYPNASEAQGFMYFPFEGEEWGIRDLDRLITEGNSKMELCFSRLGTSNQAAYQKG